MTFTLTLGKRFLLLYIFIIKTISFLFLITFLLFSQTHNESDTLKEKRVQFRRGEVVNQYSQSYDEKYEGKDLLKLKNGLFPHNRISSATGIWTELSPGIPRVTYMGLHFISQNTGWMVGEFGAIIKTTDSGTSWKVEESNITSVLTNVHSYNGQTVLACGYSGKILRSTDGGNNWLQVQSGVTGDIWGIQMINETLGWACGTSNVLLKTTDGGLSWQSKTTGISATHWQLEFMNEDYGFIACSGGIILKTSDGGDTWAVKPAGNSLSLFSLDIIDSLHIAAAGNGGKNLYSSDGGENWVDNSVLPYNETNCIRFVSIDTGYAVGLYGTSSWGIRKTVNRGLTWVTPQRGNLSEWDMQFFPGGIGFSTGSGLQINKTVNGYENWDNLFFFWDIGGISFTDEMTGFAAGVNWGGTVFKTTDGGYKWFSLPGFPWGLFESEVGTVKFIDSLTGFAGGVSNHILKTSDAGNSWNEVNLLSNTGSLTQFFFVSPQIGWASSDRVLKTTDGGETWHVQLNNSGYIIFHNIYFIDSLLGWVATSNSRPFKTTDGGANWIMQTNLPFYQTEDIVFSNSSTGCLIESRKVYRTTNGGSNWGMLFNSQWILRGFGALSSSHIFTIGDGVFETVDSGATWNEIVSLRNVGFRKFSSLNKGVGYAAGRLGLVYKYIDTTVTPVELTNFSGNYFNNKITINWTTATELNNSGFEVLRSTDKTNWMTTGFIKGNGTTTNVNKYEFIDMPQPGDYFYKLKQIDYNGDIQYSRIIEVKAIAQTSYQLYQNYPNPFNPTTTISFTVPYSTEININLYDITGRKVKTIFSGKSEEGFHSIELNAKELSAGVYFYRMTTNSGYHAVKKITLIK